MPERPRRRTLLRGGLCSLALVVAVGLWSVPAHAESVYVSDTLRVGVRPVPAANAKPFDVVVTGMKLEVLDHRDGFLRIRTSKGVEGWISDAYVTKQPPAMLRLDRVEKQLHQARQEAAKLRQSLQGARDRTDQLRSRNQALSAAQTRLQTRLKALQRAQAERARHSALWYWLIALGVVGTGGFTGGLVWHRRRVRQRLGGLRL